MDNIIPVIMETWWTHLENPMNLFFLVANDLNLNCERIYEKNIR